MKEKEDGYVGGMNVDETLLDERDEKIADDISRERRIKAVILASVAAFFLIIFVVYKIVSGADTGEKESRELVETYMEGLRNADSDMVESVMDSSTVNSETSDALVSVFQAYKNSGLTYTVEYAMGEGYVAESDDLEAVSSTIYSAGAEKAGVDRGYVVPVTGTILLNYGGETTPYEIDMDIICYEKDGEWYLGGTIEDESETDTEADS